jgi:hypothetical protein
MPVFSNVGEKHRPLAPGARGRNAAVFGLSGVEDRLYEACRADLEAVVVSLGIDKIYDIGPRSSPVPGKLGTASVASKGMLDSDEVSKLLEDSRLGFVAYPLDVIGKSSVFAAYAAHGVIPVLFSESGRNASFDGAHPGLHFLDGHKISLSGFRDDLSTIQSRALAWYESHSSRMHANALVGMLLGGRDSEASISVASPEVVLSDK